MNIYKQLKNVYGINALDNSTISQGSEKGHAEEDYFGRHYAMWSND